MGNLIRGFGAFFRDSDSQVLLVITSLLVGVGTVFYRFVEDLTWLDSVYLSVISLTTVGYGDFSPTTSAGKVFTMFYVVAGIGIFVALATEVGAHLIAARESDRRFVKTEVK